MTTATASPDLSYPIGKPQYKDELTGVERSALIDQIAAAPAALRSSITALTAEQINSPYRPGGWTVRQTVHHVADSHINAYTRFKWALAEENPAIRAYDEKIWAETPEMLTTPLEVSLSLLESLHQRWVALLRGMKPQDFRRTLNHSENGVMTLDRMLQLYAWHGRHHTAHITHLRERNGW